MMGDLSDKRCVITGAASGIGRAAVARLVHDGAQVAALDRDTSGLAKLAADIESDGHRLLTFAADVSDEASIEAAIEEAAAELGGLDVAIANAGIQLFGEDDRADRLELAVWQRTMAVNLTGVFLTCKHALRQMLAAGRGGSIICTGSPTGLRGLAPGFDAYSSSKAGVVGLARVMAADYAGDNIRVNVVVPGFTRTALVATITDDLERLARIEDAIPLGRAGEPAEVASLIAWLASDHATYVTGSVLCVDGGVLAT